MSEEELTQYINKVAAAPFTSYKKVMAEMAKKLKQEPRGSAMYTQAARVLREAAAIRLAKKGYMELPKGSFTRWIEPDWLDRGFLMGALREAEDGRILPNLVMREELVEMGKQGRKVITDTKRIPDTSAFDSFTRTYEQYQKDKRAKETIETMTTDEVLQVFNPV